MGRRNFIEWRGGIKVVSNGFECKEIKYGEEGVSS